MHVYFFFPLNKNEILKITMLNLMDLLVKEIVEGALLHLVQIVPV